MTGTSGLHSTIDDKSEEIPPEPLFTTVNLAVGEWVQLECDGKFIWMDDKVLIRKEHIPALIIGLSRLYNLRYVQDAKDEQ